MGEGACVLVLEELEHAVGRGAPIIAEVVGYGLSSDAYQPTLPAPSGDGAIRSMQMALTSAGIGQDDLSLVGYINAHATSTSQGDAIEALAIRSTFAQRPATAASPLYVSSTKGATGHLLGAAGALELAFTALTLRDNVIPPTLNLHDVEDQTGGGETFRHAPCTALPLSDSAKGRFLYALKNSFGFGGTNASIVLKRYS